jgi:Mg-chelatase subunit ChlD
MMTREDIVRMAREAELAYGSDDKPLGSVTRFAALVAAHEREACANLLLNVDLSSMDADHRLQSWTATVLLNFSDAIRARGEQ